MTILVGLSQLFYGKFGKLGMLTFSSRKHVNLHHNVGKILIIHEAIIMAFDAHNDASDANSSSSKWVSCILPIGNQVSLHVCGR